MATERDIDPALIAAMMTEDFHGVVFFEFDWPTGPVRLHSSVGDLSFGGNTWQGIGNFGQIALPEEATGTQVTRAQCTLYGLLTDDLATLGQQKIRNRDGAVWFSALDRVPGPGARLIASPCNLFFGLCDGQKFTRARAGDPQAPGLRYEHSMTLTLRTGNDPSQSQIYFHTAESPRLTDPTDTAGRHLVGMLRRALKWPEV